MLEKAVQARARERSKEGYTPMLGMYSSWVMVAHLLLAVLSLPGQPHPLVYPVVWVYFPNETRPRYTDPTNFFTSVHFSLFLSRFLFPFLVVTPTLLYQVPRAFASTPM